jgi:phosphopantothenate-cysteine ligase
MAEAASESPDGAELRRAEAYFGAHTAPPDLAEARARVASFAASLAAGERAVLVTSGGTKVALERNAVRFIDNFSSGTRGAASVEYFLQEGYAVVFLRRRGSVFPFARHLQPAIGAAGPHLDAAVMAAASVGEGGFVRVALGDGDGGSGGGGGGGMARLRAERAVRSYHRHADRGRLVCVEFETLTEYLFYLRACCEELAALGPRAALYFAAAVSDFYVPESDMAAHKIQSSDGPMTLKLEQAPKLLGCIRRHWAPNAFPDVSRYAGAMWDREPVAWRVAYRVGWWPAVQVCQSEMALCRGECSPHTGGT